MKAAADAQGIVLVLPDNPNQNCWDVGTTASLTHDGGGDTQAVALMAKYAITKYNADPARIYIMGGSGGAMLVQAMLAVYPDVFTAGAARAGVPAGCWADGYASSNQWSDKCAGGNTVKTAQQWGDMVRAMYPGYTGHRPRLQTYQGDMDTTISYKNTAESIKEWTNVMSLSTAPTSTDMGYKAQIATYNRQFWKNACDYVVFEAWTSPGGTHSMGYEEDDMLKFFGLSTATTADPEPACGGDAGGTGGMGAGGMGAGGMGAGGMGAGGIGAGGVGAGGIGAGGIGAGGIGVQGGNGGNVGGSAGTAAMTSGAGGTAGSIGGTGSTAGGSAGTTSVGGSSGGTVAGGATTGAGGKVASAGSGGNGSAGKATTPDPTPPTEATPEGCGCKVGGTQSRHGYSAAMVLGLALLGFRRRRRNPTA
jgi:poly(hydroxyalkanoate) depolymerase family esterase